MKKFFLFLLITIVSYYDAFSQLSEGDIAFVNLNASGDDDFAIVALSAIPSGSTIYFTDKTWDGSASFPGTSEGTLQWNTGTNNIEAGTIIIFTDVDNSSNVNYGVSVGDLSSPDAGFNISGSGEVLFAYVGSLDIPTTFLTGIYNSNSSITDELNNTGLTAGINFLHLNNSSSPDGGYYAGSRSNQNSYSDYQSQIYSSINWSTNASDGESFLPFSEEVFTVHTTNWTGGNSELWNSVDNWDNGIPGVNSMVIIPEVGTAPVISSSDGITVGNLSITETDGVNINSGGTLIVNGTSSGNITYNRSLGTSNWYLVGVPVSGETIEDMIANNSFDTGQGSNIGWAPYDNTQVFAADRWDYQTAASTGSLTSGGGYSVKLASPGELSFTGTMQTADVGVPITVGVGNAFNLVGNPYPSFIAGNTNAAGTNNLLTINTASLTEETLWLWNQGTGSYDQFNQASSAFQIAPGQGFFVSSNGSNTFNFTEAMQSHQATDSFQRNTSSKPEIKVLLTNGSLNRETDIYYIEGTSTGFDNGYDSTIFLGATSSFEVFTGLVSDSQGQKLGIQSLPESNFENMIIPVGVIAEASEVTISAEITNLPEGYKVFLEDKETGNFIRLDELGSKYKVNFTSPINDIGRFFLHVNTNALSNGTVDLSNISTYLSKSNNLRVVGIQNGTTQVRMFNILGKQVVRTSFEAAGVNDVALPNLQQGVYIIQINSEEGTVNKKVVVE